MRTYPALNGIISVALLLGVLLALVIQPMPALAQDEGAPNDERKPLVELTKVAPIFKKSRKDSEKDQFLVKIEGSAPRLPVGTEIEFAVMWRFKSLGAVKVKLGASKKIKKEVEAPFINGFVDGLFLKSIVRLERQSRKVQEEMKKRTRDFPEDRQPWSHKHGDKRFAFGTESEIKKQRESVQGFFREQLTALIKINKRLRSGVKKAIAKEKFMKGSRFDPDAYRKWIEKEIRAPLEKAQKAAKDAEKQIRFLEVQRDLGYLLNVTRGIAKSIGRESMKVYRAHGTSEDFDVTSPKKLDLNFRGKPTNKKLTGIIKRICDSQGIDPATLAAGR